MKELQRRRRCQEQERANPPHHGLFCSVPSCSVMCCYVLFCPVLFHYVLSRPDLFCPVLSCPVVPCPVRSCSIMNRTERSRTDHGVVGLRALAPGSAFGAAIPSWLARAGHGHGAGLACDPRDTAVAAGSYGAGADVPQAVKPAERVHTETCGRECLVPHVPRAFGARHVPRAFSARHVPRAFSARHVPRAFSARHVPRAFGGGRQTCCVWGCPLGLLLCGGREGVTTWTTIFWGPEQTLRAWALAQCSPGTFGISRDLLQGKYVVVHYYSGSLYFLATGKGVSTGTTTFREPGYCSPPLRKPNLRTVPEPVKASDPM
eukprot:gene23655-biopygen10373